MEFKNKVALITGAGSGIGRSTAQLLAEKGAVIAAVDLDFEALKSLKDEIAQDCLIIKTNVTSVKEINEMVEKVIKEMDKIERVSVRTPNSITSYNEGEDYSFTEVEGGYLLLKDQKFEGDVIIHSFNLVNAREISIRHNLNSVILYY